MEFVTIMVTHALNLKLDGLHLRIKLIDSNSLL